ncbi:MAG: hypothetical protein K9M98_00910 [Cephaloticoccus sp.]|nr:hypothetical protein [Cephaloticoccus sp.]MCF7759038.1 hypothetical protein [Cephaloticoccus sp.]
MKKKSLVIVGSLVALLLIVYVGLSFFLGSIVTAGVNTFGPKLTQTKVELAGARISPFTGSGTLSGLTVGNPEGWSDGNAFTLGKIHLSVQPFSILGDHIVINEISIDEPVFRYETKIIASNIKDLLKNIEAFTGAGGQEPKAKSGRPIKFVVKKLRITNAIAKLGVGPAAIPLPMPPIAIDDLGVKEGGITPDQFVGVVMQNVLGGIVSATAGAAGEIGSTMGASASEAVGSAAKKTGEGIKKLFGK